MSWLEKYPDGGKLNKSKKDPPTKVPFNDINDPLRPKGLGVQVQDNLRPLPLFDQKAIQDSKTPEAKTQRAKARAAQAVNNKKKADVEIARRKALIDKSNKEGGFKNSAVAEKMRLFPDDASGWGEVFDDYLNLPRILIGQSADAIGHANSPKELAMAAAAPVVMGATGYNPLGTAINVAKSPITRSLVEAPINLYNAFIGNELKQFNNTQAAAPLVDDVTYNSLRNINKAGNIFKNESIPFDQRVNRLIKMDIPEEQVIKLTGKTRQELLQEANEFANIKKTALETGEPVRSNGTIDLTRPNRRPRPSQNLTPEELAIAEQQRIIDNLPASEQNEYYRNLVNTLPESRFNLTRGNGLSVDEIRQRIQQNINQNAYYNEFDIQQYLTGQRSTPQMAQMQKANNINNRVDKFTNKLYSRKFSKQYLPAYDETQEVTSLIPSITRAMTSDVEGVIKQNLSKVSGANKGDLFRGATSLSDGSFPAYIRNIQREAQRGVGEPIFGGYQDLNTMGFLKQAGVTNEQTAGYLNKYITDFNKTTGKNIPKAYIENDRVQYPDIIFKKFEQGGTLNNWLNKY